MHVASLRRGANTSNGLLACKTLHRDREHDYALSLCVRELYQVPPGTFTDSFPFCYWTFWAFAKSGVEGVPLDVGTELQ